MTAREMIQAKPPAVREVIRIFMVVLVVKDGRPDETEEEKQALAHEALTWWSGVYLDATELAPMTEVQLAQDLIARIRKQDVWGKILRGKAN